MEEIWKDIEGYEGLYQVSNLGRVKSIEHTVTTKNGKTLVVKSCIRKLQKVRGYNYIGLTKEENYSLKKVARLVAKAFLPNPEGLPEVNHIDENKLNDSVLNLEWCSRNYNINYGTRNTRVANCLIKEVYQYSMNGELLNRFNSLSEAAKANNYLVGNLCVACNKVKEGATACNCFFSYTPLSDEELQKAIQIKNFYITHRNRHPRYNDIKKI